MGIDPVILKNKFRKYDASLLKPEIYRNNQEEIIKNFNISRQIDVLFVDDTSFDFYKPDNIKPILLAIKKAGFNVHIKSHPCWPPAFRNDVFPDRLRTFY